MAAEVRRTQLSNEAFTSDGIDADIVPCGAHLSVLPAVQQKLQQLRRKLRRRMSSTTGLRASCASWRKSSYVQKRHGSRSISPCKHSLLKKQKWPRYRRES